MYVTRPLSRYLDDWTAALEPPPEGPGSGFLVVVDETGETARTRFWGLCVDRRMRRLPFPQNRHLQLRPNTNPDLLESTAIIVDVASEIAGAVAGIRSGRVPGSRAPQLPEYALLVPVVGQPLSSGRYYVVKTEGKHKGKVSACSREEDRSSSWFGSWVNDVKPRAFDRVDLYQQVCVQYYSEGFQAVAVATDGIPPDYLRKKGWKAYTTMSPKYDLTDDAQGMDCALRRQMPDFESVSISAATSPVVVVGRWYVPFMFVKADGDRRIKDQFRRCTFYQMTMDQFWLQIYSLDNPGTEVKVTALVSRSDALLGGTNTVHESRPVQAGYGAVWFRPAAASATTATVALDMVVWERMTWELERGGWVDNGNQDERIERVERSHDPSHRQYHKFACYVLVERFMLKRMDGTPALFCHFTHTDKIKFKWL